MSVWMNSCSRKSMGTVLGDMIYKAFYCLGDVSRSRPMTVEYSVYTQSLTEKPVKGMLTGPVTIFNWSFPRCWNRLGCGIYSIKVVYYA